MEERNLRKTRVGTVVSNKMDKTVVVAVKDNVRHPLYKKILKRTVTFKAMTRTTHAVLATGYRLWRHARCPRTNTGELSK